MTSRPAPFEREATQEGMANSTTSVVSLSVMTYNIHRFAPSVKLLLPWVNSGPENRMGDLMKTVIDGKSRPTFALLQESWTDLSSTRIQSRAGYKGGIHTERPSGLSVYGNGIATLYDWNVLGRGKEFWKNVNPKQFEGGLGAHKGFSYVKLQHPSNKNLVIVVYNLHGMAADLNRADAEKKAYDNFKALADHIRKYAPTDAVIVGGDFNWRWRWRKADGRPELGDVDQTYNNVYPANQQRFVPFGALTDAGLVDYEMALKGRHEFSTPVDRVFFKSGSRVKLVAKKSDYLDKGTPWETLSDHNPLVLTLEATVS